MMKMNDNYVDELNKLKEPRDTYTCDELDQIEDSPTFYSLKEAIRNQAKFGGTIYTQVDSETDDSVIYVKGIHIVNRTGIYAVVRL